jgi:hypothetical protein
MGDCTSAVHPPSPDEIKHQFSWLYLGAEITLAVLTAPYRRTFKMYTWMPLKDLRHVGDDRKAMIFMIRDFQIDKYCELQSVQVAVRTFLLNLDCICPSTQQHLEGVT